MFLSNYIILYIRITTVTNPNPITLRRLITADSLNESDLEDMTALCKAGERHHDANGGDSSLSAQASGQTMKTNVEYNQREVDWEAVHKSYREHHPAFVEGW